MTTKTRSVLGLLDTARFGLMESVYRRIYIDGKNELIDFAGFCVTVDTALISVRRFLPAVIAALHAMT
jgi:hypothetical protein